MKVSVEPINQITSRIHVELPEEAVSRQLKKAYNRLNRSAKVRGFRPGKVPLTILKRHYGDQVNQEVGLELVNDTLMAALEQTEMEVVSQSDLDRKPLQEGEPFHYSFLVELKPQVHAQDYKNIPAKRPPVDVSDEEVAAELALRRQTNFHLKSIGEPRPIQQGDHAVLDFKTFADGKPVPDGEAQGFHLEVGSNRFNPEFENKLLGASKGEEREIQVAFPADYGNKNLAGKNVTFQVAVKDIKEKVLPELNDEFAKGLGEFESLEDLRSAVRQELKSSKTKRIDDEIWVQISDELIKRNPFEVPKSMVEQELQRMLDTIRYRLSSQNLTLEQAGMDEDTFRERNRELAEKRVRTSILLEKISHQESLEISDEELDQSLHSTAEKMNQPYDKVRDFYLRSNMMDSYKHQLLEDKVINYLRDQADITEVDEIPTSGPEEKQSESEENS
ncbi:MAG: trigger factor [Deltaproteobacteria bacterium]|nr:MAG: trigger factor [Deltaproteobacteria bacterium]